MKHIYHWSLLILSMLSCACGEKFDVKVLDAEAQPVEGASVMIQYAGPGPKYDRIVEGLTNADGGYSCRRPNDMEHVVRISARISKKGYYANTYLNTFAAGKDHVLATTLRKKKNPIAMFAKKQHVSIGVQGQPVGFDFEVGDLVAPHGKGESTDVLFTVTKKTQGRWSYDCKLEVSFPSPGDGIQPFFINLENVSETTLISQLKSPYEAPVAGYKKSFVRTDARKDLNSPLVTNKKNLRNHWMRIRTKTDSEGNVISANYVKIYGDFPQIFYYLNPTPNDRNLEFDPEQNLLKGLSDKEKVKAP